MKVHNYIYGAIFLMSSQAIAEQHTFSLGLAESAPESRSVHLHGGNVKYNYLFQQSGSPGVTVSTSYTRNGQLKLLTPAVGPSWKFNDYFTVYGLLGPAVGSAVLAESGKRQYGIVSGMGVMLSQPASPLRLDVSYERSSVRDTSVNSFIFGVGYSF